ncbi:MAG: ornithine cyclodeaminase family protein [Actinomycetota bacterium]
MKTPDTLLLTGSEIAELLTLPDCIEAVEEAFRLHGEGLALAPGVLGMHAREGGFHIKAGLLHLRRNYFAAKTNANFPCNPSRGLPLIQGLVLLFDGDRGCLLAAMDSTQITIRRTGAATAIAAKHLSRADSRTITICGCGNQGREHLRALTQVRKLERGFAWYIDFAAAKRFAADMATVCSLEPVRDLSPALRQSDICVTCTPAEKYFIRAEDLQPGTFVAGVGADNEHKQELDPLLFGSGNKVVVDVLDQCASIGDLHHAIKAGVTGREGVHAELGEIICGKKAGRLLDEEITIYDSTGMALQDVASAAMAYEKAMMMGKRKKLDFMG